MNKNPIIFLGFLTLALPVAADPKPGPSPDEPYKKLTPDSMAQPGIPRGTLSEFDWNDSKIYPGTVRKVSVYVPQQIDPKKPAAVFVCQDGVSYKAPTVFDNLIHKKEMPVTVGIFIRPGDQPRKPGEPPRLRSDGRPAPPANRSVEYDTLSNTYATFLLQEILPEVARKYQLNLTSDPAERCIAGNSSGGICAFTVCWEHPEEFGKCFTTVGSFTNIRGGNLYPELVRTSPKKPIRIFQQAGANDLVNQYGSWPEANKAMAAALKEKGYDHKFVLGDGVHSANHGTQIFPDAMRWMWRDHGK
ncbi:MAG: alpha/beta hydrolase [Luteolibacter sp.]